MHILMYTFTTYFMCGSCYYGAIPTALKSLGLKVDYIYLYATPRGSNRATSKTGRGKNQEPQTAKHITKNNITDFICTTYNWSLIQSYDKTDLLDSGYIVR